MNVTKTMVTAHKSVTTQLVAINAFVMMDSYWQMMNTVATVNPSITHGIKVREVPFSQILMSVVRRFILVTVMLRVLTLLALTTVHATLALREMERTALVHTYVYRKHFVVNLYHILHSIPGL